MNRVKALIASVLILSGCGERGAPDMASKPDVKTEIPAKAARLDSAQKQFLAIETATSSRPADVLVLPGRVTFRPQAQSAVGATVAGRVVALFVRAGEKVKAGAPLVAIESADAAAARARFRCGSSCHPRSATI